METSVPDIGEKIVKEEKNNTQITLLNNLTWWIAIVCSAFVLHSLIAAVSPSSGIDFVESNSSAVIPLNCTYNVAYVDETEEIYISENITDSFVINVTDMRGIIQVWLNE